MKSKVTVLLLACSLFSFSLSGYNTASPSGDADVLLTEVLDQLSEQYQVFFAYDADLLRNVEVDADLSQYKSLEESVSSLLHETGLKFSLIGDKYCVIYKNTKKGARTKRKLERKFEQIETLQKRGDVSIQTNTAPDNSMISVSAIAQGYSDITAIARLKGEDPGRMRGKILDASSGEALIGANVLLRGTTYGAASDYNGDYIIHGIPAGTYTALFSYIGYQDLDTVNIVIVAGSTLELNVEINPAGVVFEEVEVNAQAMGQMAAINQQLNSNAITNIVASDRIKEVPDVNAAESIGRLPGVSLKRSGGEGNKIVVRGLSPQYTIVEVDGVRLTGVDGDRSVGLSVISSEMLEGIELSKSLTPDQDADAIGGIVNLRLKDADKDFHFGGLVRGGYNDLETSFNNYKVSAYAGNRFFSDKLGILANIGHEQVIRSSDQFSATYLKNIAETNDLYTSSAAVRELKAIRQRSHGSLVLDYKADFVKVQFSNFYSRMENDNEVRNNVFRFNNNDFRFEISESEPIESIQSHSLRSTFTIYSTELNVEASYSKTKLNLHRDQYNFVDNNVLGGSSISENRKLFAQPTGLIDEYFDISSSMQSVLLDNVRSTSLREDKTQTYNFDWKVPYRFSDISGFITLGGKYSNKERSNDTESRQAYYWGGIGIGRVHDFVYPEFPEFYRPQDVGITNAEGLVGYNFDDPGYDYGDILNGRFELGWSADLEKLQETHDHLYRNFESNMLWQQGVESNREDYVNTEELTAGYVMAEINFGKRLMVLSGVRFERMYTKYTANYLLQDAFDPDGVKWIEPVTAYRRNSYWFPSINLKYKINDWSDLRAAAYRSASRPDYRFLSPGMTANDNKTVLNSYNPYLKPSLANNYDLGISFFANKLGLFTINGFYKQISDLIYRLPRYQPEYFDRLEGAPTSFVESLEAPRALYDEDLFNKAGTSNDNVPINNPNDARFSGFELSWQTNFWYLPGLLSGLVLDLNYSMIWSKTEFPFLDIVTTWDDTGIIPIPIETPVYNTREARMLDQPAYLFNARVGWDYKGFSSRVSFRYQGETINSLDPVHSLLDEVSGDMFRIDVQLSQKIAEKFTISVDLANLNNFVDDAYLKTQGYILPTSSEFYGFTAQANIRYDF